MSDGYTPLFRSVFSGTLCGQYPDTAAWLFLLALADKNGCVDCTPQYISGVTGMPIEDLTQCIARFCEPDPNSRTAAEGGRRLVPIDPTRAWGWRIVNHTLYRERARKAAYDQRRIDSGENAERMRRRYASSTGNIDPTRPDATRADPLSNTNTNTNTNEEIERHERPAQPCSSNGHSSEEPNLLDFKLAYPVRGGSQPWPRTWTAIQARLRGGATWAELLAGAQRYAAYCDATGKTGTEFVMQAATFCGPDMHFLQDWALPARADKPVKPTWQPRE